jgi:hypothetical protein
MNSVNLMSPFDPKRTLGKLSLLSRKFRVIGKFFGGDAFRPDLDQPTASYSGSRRFPPAPNGSTILGFIDDNFRQVKEVTFAGAAA